MRGASEQAVREKARSILLPYLVTRQIPVDLSGILAQLGMGQVLVKQSAGRHGAIYRNDNKWHPVVFRRHLDGPDRLSNRERFTIAHEIAHALLSDQAELTPRRTRDYWVLEEVCNEFAARLLLPDSSLSYLDAHQNCEGVALLNEVLTLGTTGKVSRPVAAKRICDYVTGTTVIGAAKRWSSRFSRDTYRVAWTAGAERLGLRTGVHLDPDSELGRWMLDVRGANAAEAHVADVEFGFRSLVDQGVIVAIQDSRGGNTRQLELW